ncbi:hypothetical protein ABMA28_009069 [Loxostege sticticalis]|uniref:C2H2-type domain-containing protein n=1 Tax=Loxostege sticticalis TaxID=481309 RepID=A0ABD0SGK2_LOXSC
MATSVMKVEVEAEACCLCGGGGELLSPEEYDANATVMLAPLRAMLLHLNNNKVVPDGRFCGDCIRRTIDSYEFSTALSTKSVPPLSEKIRALRRRLHELTQKIDVFIVVGGPGVNAGGTYSEEDIIMVEKDALAAAAAADDEDLERARNARGDTVYQCSVCPHSFQRVSEYRAHMATHPLDALHSCWTCGAQFAARDALREHAAEHRGTAALTCHLCNTTFQSQAELRRHEGGCAGACPACGTWCGSRPALSAHAVAQHARTRPALCPACFKSLPTPDALAAHMLRHRQAKQYVCGYDGCILRFGTRANLMSHIRKCHAGAAEPPEPAAAATTCEHCQRTFASVAAMKRHARVHRNRNEVTLQEEGNESQLENDGSIEGMELSMAHDGQEGDVEYLEVETLEEIEYQGE